MPLNLEMKFDGGLQEYSAKLKELGEGLKDFSGLFRDIMDYFEGQDIKGLKVGSLGKPIHEIFESKGQKIGADWTNESKYDAWKEKHPEVRKYDVPITGNQVLSGHLLHSLLNDADEDAVRTIDKMSMVYGVNNKYTIYWQEKRRILDFFPEMVTDINHILVAWLKGYLDDIKE